jgi:hypothetical protein
MIANYRVSTPQVEHPRLLSLIPLDIRDPDVPDVPKPVPIAQEVERPAVVSVAIGPGRDAELRAVIHCVQACQ